ncbi:unnamed protein product [Schistosoma haematobium]|nr:unnamed protein product [Schistosoma haematobium]
MKCSIRYATTYIYLQDVYVTIPKTSKRDYFVELNTNIASHLVFRLELGPELSYYHLFAFAVIISNLVSDYKRFLFKLV